MATRVAGNNRAMAMATKRTIATNGNNMGNGYGKDDGGNGPWFVCVFWCVWRDHIK
jgi:hypothetical protein